MSQIVSYYQLHFDMKMGSCQGFNQKLLSQFNKPPSRSVNEAVRLYCPDAHILLARCIGTVPFVTRLVAGVTTQLPGLGARLAAARGAVTSMARLDTLVSSTRKRSSTWSSARELLHVARHCLSQLWVAHVYFRIISAWINLIKSNVTWRAKKWFHYPGQCTYWDCYWSIHIYRFLKFIALDKKMILLTKNTQFLFLTVFIKCFDKNRNKGDILSLLDIFMFFGLLQIISIQCETHQARVQASSWK